MSMPLHWKDLWQQARQEIVQHNYAKAEELLSPMLKQQASLELALDSIQVLMKRRKWVPAQGLLAYWLQEHSADHRLHGLQAQIEYAQGQYAAARTRYQQLLVSAPKEPKYWVNLAYCCAALSDLPAAITAFERSAPLLDNPDPRWHYNYGMSLLLDQQPLKSLSHFAECAPYYQDDPELCFHYALAYDLSGQTDQALQQYEKNTQKWPDDLRSWHNAGILCYRMEQKDKAQQFLEQVLKRDPQHPIAAPLAHALSGKELATFPSLFVKMLFDQYAFNYDQHLRETLDYQGPLRARQLLSEALPELQAGVVYDLGCGTGLLAPLVRDIATTLIGFDLSEGMIAQAKKQGLYEHLVTARIPQELSLYHEVPDYLFAIELSNYLGADWERCVQRASELLPADGIFVFTAETHQESEPWILHQQARYAYRPSWLRQILQKFGFVILQEKMLPLRQQAQQQLLGLYVVAQKKS